MSLPTDKQARKNIPLYRGFFCYFPDAIAAVAELSMIGNQQHNPGEPLHWARDKSTDEEDAQLRHMLDKASGKPLDEDRVRHATKAAWRALAGLQKEIEAERAAAALLHPASDDVVDIRPGAVITATKVSELRWCEPCKRYVPIESTAPGQAHFHRVEQYVPCREDRERK